MWGECRAWPARWKQKEWKHKFMSYLKSFFSFSVLARIVASVFLLWGVSRHPYGFYTLLRWIVCATAAYTAYICTTMKRIPWAWVLAVIALLFNPFIPPRIERATWIYIDVATGIILLASIFVVRESSKLRVEPWWTQRHITSGKKTLHICICRGRFIAFTRGLDATQHLWRAKATTFCRGTLCAIQKRLTCEK